MSDPVGNRNAAHEAAALALLDGMTVWRGQWCGEPVLRSALPTITFGSRAAAERYASEPNDRNLARGREVRPVLFEARLDLGRIWCRIAPDDFDPFIDLDAIASEFGREIMLAVVRDCRGQIEETGGYEDLHAETGLDLDGMLEAWTDRIGFLPPVLGHLALRVPEFVEALKAAGYDGVMIGGCGDNALEAEWHIFDPARALDPETGRPIGEPDAATPLDTDSHL